MTDDILAMQLPQKIQTLQGMNVSFTEDDPSLMVDSATILNPDVQAANGVIHVIDGVLTPTPGDTPQ